MPKELLLENHIQLVVQKEKGIVEDCVIVLVEEVIRELVQSVGVKLLQNGLNVEWVLLRVQELVLRLCLIK